MDIACDQPDDEQTGGRQGYKNQQQTKQEPKSKEADQAVAKIESRHATVRARLVL